mgnify:CR=1 FL=1
MRRTMIKEAITPENTANSLRAAVLLPLGDKLVSAQVRGSNRDQERSFHGARNKDTVLNYSAIVIAEKVQIEELSPPIAERQVRPTLSSSPFLCFAVFIRWWYVTV